MYFPTEGNFFYIIIENMKWFRFYSSILWISGTYPAKTNFGFIIRALYLPKKSKTKKLNSPVWIVLKVCGKTSGLQLVSNSRLSSTLANSWVIPFKLRLVWNSGRHFSPSLSKWQTGRQPLWLLVSSEPEDTSLSVKENSWEVLLKSIKEKIKLKLELF